MLNARDRTTPLCFLMGPTGAGKTDVAIELVSRYPCDIISVDSAMVYRRMNIGTGKPDPHSLRLAPHRLIDVREPEQTYSAAEFREDAIREIESIVSCNRVPLLVGGTGLYFRALSSGLSRLPGRNRQVRDEIEQEAKSCGWLAMHALLERLDPASANRIHPNDPQRIQRALEVYRVTGRAMSTIVAETARCGVGRPIRAVVLAPLERSVLHRHIEKRFDAMLADGLLNEVSSLMKRPGLHSGSPSMRAVGYRQTWAHLVGQTDYKVMRDQAIAATRQLARRQLTWLRSEAQAKWVDTQKANVVEEVAKHFNLRDS